MQTNDAISHEQEAPDEEYEAGLNQFTENFRLKYEAENPEEVATFMNSYPPEDYADAAKLWSDEFWSRYKDEIHQLWAEEWAEKQQ